MITTLNLIWRAIQLFGARVIGQVAGFAAAIMVARELGPEPFGRYTFALVVGLLLAGVPGAGVDLAALRFCAREAAQPARARAALLLCGAAKAGCALLLGLSVMLLAGPLADLMGQAALATPLRYAALSALPLALTELALAALQAQERYQRLLLVNVLVALIKAGPVIGLVLLRQLTLELALDTVLLSAYAAASMALLAAWWVWRGPAQFSRALSHELLRFGGWSTLTTVVGVVSGNLDTLALTWLAGTAANGVYAAGRTLAFPLAIAASALGMVLLPNLSKLREAGQLVERVRRVTLPLIAGAAGLTLLVTLLAEPLVRLVYAGEYRGAAGVLQLLALAYAVQIVVWPTLAGLLALDRPELVAYASLTILAVTALGYALVTPHYGAVGAAGVLALVYALTLWPYHRLLRRAAGQATIRQQEPHGHEEPVRAV